MPNCDGAERGPAQVHDNEFTRNAIARSVPDFQNREEEMTAFNIDNGVAETATINRHATLIITGPRVSILLKTLCMELIKPKQRDCDKH